MLRTVPDRKSGVEILIYLTDNNDVTLLCIIFDIKVITILGTYP